MDAPGLEYEEALWRRGITLVAGVDEVGRGPLAGPVVAAAVVLDRGGRIEGATDSKRLSGLRREELSREILARARFVGIGAGSVREIDGTGIAHATALAVHRALMDLPTRPEHVVLDGRPLSRLSWPHEAVVKGDALVHSIACASIVAKVCRDRLMRRLHQRYPGFGWARNVGYGTREHMEALRALGPTPHHRRSFGGVQLPLDLSDASR